VKVYLTIDDFVKPPQAIVTIGTFDGVHVGHQKIIQRLKEIAKAEGGETVILTFFPHPRMVLHPDDTNLHLLNTLEEKIALLRHAGIDHLIIHPFTKTFSELGYKEFVQQILVDKIGVKKLVIGYDHRFGNKREGSFELLQQIAPELGFSIEEIPEQDVNQIAVSSTKIRNALVTGDIATANKYLGSHYSLCGTVVEGNKLGRTIGFPTANIAIDQPYKLTPADGVYVVKVHVGGIIYGGMMNIGMRPTLDGKKRTIEVHILEFNNDIYQQPILIEFLSRLRDEVKFDGMEQLKKQLELDKIAAQLQLQKIETYEA
jgi:riboflavin kinase/FMN adenylyltransferase